jgi:25S rRNA (uracil2843-N3)-methyltransferase
MAPKKGGLKSKPTKPSSSASRLPDSQSKPAAGALKEQQQQEQHPLQKRRGRRLLAEQIPLALQQTLLDVFRDAFPQRFGPDLSELLQQVKKCLYERDFAAAFGRDDFLEAYAVRWSPGRAIGYAEIFAAVLKEHVLRKHDALKVVCFGGGAGAELVGFAGAVKMLLDADDESRADVRDSSIALVDIANWKPVLEKLFAGLTTPPPISKYAAAHVKANNVALVQPMMLSFSSLQLDVLAMSRESLSDLVNGIGLITIFFTLNELYSASISKTNSFLLTLSEAVDPGTFLVVVDSAGSYATVSLNGSEKQYPMSWLLDHALLGGSNDKTLETDPKWSKIEEIESQWFRIPEEVKYPLELESMRYQLHLYQRRAKEDE